MNPEIKIIALVGLLQAAQLLLAVIFGDAQTGIKYGLSPRDEARPLTGTAGRIDRALNNHFAAMALFTIAVITVTLTLKSSYLTITCAWVYLAARTLYVPAYIFGVPWVRSILWTIAFGATVIMLIVAVI